MDIAIRDRSKQFINKGIERLEDTKTGLDREFAKLQSIYKEYAETSSLLIESRREYIAYLEKYEDGESAPVMASFPGIAAHLPTYSANEMQSDSTEMKELSETIKALFSQVAILEEQLQLTLSRVVNGTKHLVRYSSQTTGYLDELVTQMDSAYDIGNLASSAE